MMLSMLFSSETNLGDHYMTARERDEPQQIRNPLESLPNGFQPHNFPNAKLTKNVTIFKKQSLGNLVSTISDLARVQKSVNPPSKCSATNAGNTL